MSYGLEHFFPESGHGIERRIYGSYYYEHDLLFGVHGGFLGVFKLLFG